MIDLTNVTHHPAIEEIVDILCTKSQNTDRGFFRVEVAYFLAKLASNMRATIVTQDRGDIPVNMYVLALATSGFGKGLSMSIMEDDLTKGFRKRFLDETMPVIAEQHIRAAANESAGRNLADPEDEFKKLENIYKRTGAFAFTFDSGTSPAVKQLRHKLLMANCGSINLQIDEIGSNLLGVTDVLTLFLELYDQGKVKQKLTKNTADNERNDEVEGKTPTNMLLFGTPSKLLDGGQTEDQFYSFLETGYARRCLFGFGHHSQKAYHTQTAAEIYNKLIDPGNEAMIIKWADVFTQLADPGMYGWKIAMEPATAIRLLEYRIECEKEADLLAEHEDVRKAELNHRYFKALKLAGAFAFVDSAVEIEIDHIMQAILLVQESGEAFQTILTREKSYVKLAKYIASLKHAVTHADLHEALPFYKSSSTARNEIMGLAMAWGYPRHIIIKKTFNEGIEFFQGETLKETNIDEMTVAYSDHWAYNYLAEKVKFSELHVVTQADGYNWVNHALRNGHRAEENVISGFNMVVVDVDGGVRLETVHELLKEYKFLTYTTKRHTDEEHRFRVIIPTNYNLTLDSDEYKEFMTNVLGWLPFGVDESANQRARKWSSHHLGTYHYNLDGDLLDVLPFIPKTSRNETYQKNYQSVQSMDNLERWFASRMASGNRNNNMLKYAMALVDSNMTLLDVQKQVKSFNAKLSNKLTEDEIDSTIMVSVAKRYQN